MSELRVGFGRVNITPSYSVPLYGYSNSSGRMSERVLDPLFATCLAFTDGDGETELIYTLDMCSPFEMTFVLTSANMGEYHGYMYIPSQMGFAHGGYSADTCIFLPGTGEKLAWEYIHMLYDLYRPEEL